MPTTRVKICGITRPEDVASAADVGADAIGLNFVGGPRKISYERALTIINEIPPLMQVVGLFDAQSYAEADSALDLLFNQVQDSIEISQWYGELGRISPGGLFSGPRGAPWWLVLPIASRESLGDDLRRLLAHFPHNTRGVVLDTASTSARGGTGKSFNWHWIAEARAAGELEGVPPIILAGGLTPENVAEAVRIARPYAVDVSSGVEVAGKPGVKDAVKMRDFIQAAKGV